MGWKESNSEMFNIGNLRNACYNCTERHVGCHSTCEKYAEYQKELEKGKKLYDECRRNDIYEIKKACRYKGERNYERT